MISANATSARRYSIHPPMVYCSLNVMSQPGASSASQRTRIARAMPMKRTTKPATTITSCVIALPHRPDSDLSVWLSELLCTSSHILPRTDCCLLGSDVSGYDSVGKLVPDALTITAGLFLESSSQAGDRISVFFSINFSIRIASSPSV